MYFVLALIPLLYEPCGRWFEACLKRQRSERSVSVVEETDGGTEEVEVDDAEITDDEKTFILSLASSEWKVTSMLILMKWMRGYWIPYLPDS